MNLARLQRWLRLRDRHVDRARQMRAETERRRDAAAQQLAASTRALGQARGDFTERSRDGANAMFWATAQAGLAHAAERMREAERALGEANEEDQQALAALEAAHRSREGLARIVDREQDTERRDRERAEEAQRDEVGQRVRRLASWALAVWIVAMPTAPHAEGEAPPSSDPGSITRLVEELRQRETQLDRRERELNDREVHVGDLEKRVMASLAELEELASAIEKRISDWEQANGDKSIARLAKIYGTMDARRAAPLLEELELDLATRIIAKMKHKESAALLPLMSQERALAMSRNVAHPLGGPAAMGEKP
ncbi:MAG: hypothetical protein AAF430_03035 [Myxococcota bacterium]